MENSDANKFSDEITSYLLEKFRPADRKLILLQVDANIRTAHEQTIDSCEKSLVGARMDYEQFLNPQPELKPMKN